MYLPTELRLQVYDYLLPVEPFVRVYSQVHLRFDKRLPVGLEVMRVSKALHEEATKHFFNKSTLLVEACKIPYGRWTQGCFTEPTAGEYAALVMSMSPELRRRLTRLEFQILPDSSQASLNPSYDQLDKSPLRKVCAALPNLESILFSYPSIRDRELSPYGDARRQELYDERASTVDWICAQLPEKGLRFAWDLTNFRYPIEDARQLRGEIMFKRESRYKTTFEWKMKKLIERDGSLELAQSVTATREDLQRWSEIREVVTQAVTKC